MTKIEKYLNKDSKNFTKKDIIRFAKENDIKALNFRYVASDGKLKTLNFVYNDFKYLDKILSCGERVDGSSLFKNIDASASDLYVIPKYSSVFINPFSENPTLEIICSFYDKDGNPFSSSPENILRKAELEFKKSTGLELHTLGELEYYVISQKNMLYPTLTQKGYHESYPYNKWEFLRTEAASLMSEAGCHIKYAHSEVGFIRTQEEEMSQNEIEFLPVNVSKSADELAIARWILSSIGYKYGVVITFAPKISIGHAGSGFHIHSCLIKNGKNQMNYKGELSDDAMKLIAGYLFLSKSITAFGNTVPTSYLRLVPNQEAPINICWGYRNRSALIRVPLGWNNGKSMAADLNNAKDDFKYESNQTVEIRSADGSANVYLLLSALCCAALSGFEMKKPLDYAKSLFVDKNIFHEKENKFESLPNSCYESAQILLKDRAFYERHGIFPPSVIDSISKKLSSYNDKNLSEKLYGKEEEIKKLVDEYLYC